MAVVPQHRIDGREFNRLVSPLLGLPVTRPWRGHGSAVFFELGPLKRVPRTHRPGHSLRGLATVMLEGIWRVERQHSIDFGADSAGRRIALRLRQIRRLVVQSIRLEGRLPELEIGLSNGRYVKSFMSWEAQPRWVLFLPDESWLCVSRGRVIPKVAAERRGG